MRSDPPGVQVAWPTKSGPCVRTRIPPATRPSRPPHSSRKLNAVSSRALPQVHSSIPRWGDRPGGAAVAPFAASAGGTPAARSVSMMDQVMAISERSARSPVTAAGHAERVYSIAEGATPPSGVEDVSSSWQRSANKHGVDPADRTAPRILTTGELKPLREPLDELVFSAQEEIDQLYRVVREAGYTILFCDGAGVAIEHRVEDPQASRFEHWVTRLAALRSEERK